jgi:hypothetical protein
MTTERRLREDLDAFKHRHQNAKIEYPLIRLTAAFDRPFIGKPAVTDRPHSLQGEVHGYVIRNGPILTKYGTWDKTGFAINEFDSELRALSLLCVDPIQNTSFTEIDQHRQQLSKKNRKKASHKVMGIRNGTLDQIAAQANLQPEDQLFMFGEHHSSAESVFNRYRARLNQLWLQQFLWVGGKAPNLILPYCKEDVYIDGCYHELLQDEITRAKVEPFSYAPGKGHHTEESVEFLYQKLRSAQRANVLHSAKLARSRWQSCPS